MVFTIRHPTITTNHYNYFNDYNHYNNYNDFNHYKDYNDFSDCNDYRDSDFRFRLRAIK